MVLRLLLGLNAGDILYITSKASGGYDDGAYNKTCYKIQPSVTTPEMKQYLSSEEWYQRNEIAFMLHKAANVSLDLTIQSIGHGTFHKALEEHRYLMELVNSRCAPRAVFPCTKNGTRLRGNGKNATIKDCYWGDSGCGYRCLDELYLNFTKGLR